jgi:hypothetical protein
MNYIFDKYNASREKCSKYVAATLANMKLSDLFVV